VAQTRMATAGKWGKVIFFWGGRDVECTPF